jgi:hypothetical protein
MRVRLSDIGGEIFISPNYELLHSRNTVVVYPETCKDILSVAGVRKPKEDTTIVLDLLVSTQPVPKFARVRIERLLPLDSWVRITPLTHCHGLPDSFCLEYVQKLLDEAGVVLQPNSFVELYLGVKRVRKS